ncbi:MAG TPA: LysR family transcriptional regulator [Burkholderiales bacterium]|nr:LysR family transcriptional regulator [Burkholderiales bacterium]
MRISLEQWSALVSVVESGSYAKAGERLHKSQSTLTYAIQKLEEGLGVKAFEIRGRKAALTPTGEMLYRRGKALVEEAARLEHAAAELAHGWEPEIRLAVEVIYPTWLLLRSLERFAAERPGTRIELLETVLGGNEEALVQRKAHFAIGPVVPAGFVGDALMPVRFVCVAAPGHPLHRLGRPAGIDDLRQHRHLVVRDSGELRAGRAAWLNENRWTVTSKATSIRAAVMGLGYAWYPENSVREELERGALRPLPLREGAERHAMLHLIYADRDAAGPGTRRLAEIIREETRAACKLETQPG